MTALWPAGWAPNPDRPPTVATARAGPLILTAALPQALQAAADADRTSRYPEGAARAPAHVALFRHLPGPMAAELGRSIARLAGQMPPPLLETGPKRYRNGALMLPVRSPRLEHLRAELADHWHGLLSPGDIAPPALHITLAGARAPKRAALETGPAMPAGPWRCQGLLLWRARGYGETCWTPLVAWRFHR